MDPQLLLGLVNTDLRNHRENLEDLCRSHGIDRPALEACLASAGFRYVPELRQFRRSP